MSHDHTITDSDLHFIIDPITRTIESQSDNRYLTQLDHESARLTFEIPLTVEGHNMSKCDRIEIHFTNITKKKDAQSDGVYIVKDSDREIANDKFLFSWKVRRESTVHAGRLNFSITFLCCDEDLNVTYEWSTTEYKYMQVLPRLDHTISDIVNYPDLYEQFKKELMEEFQLDENEVNAIIKKYLDANPIKAVTSWNDLTDRTHYTEEVENIILPSVEVTTERLSIYFRPLKSLDIEPLGLELGKKYTVIFDGTEYVNVTCVNVTIDGMDYCCIGPKNPWIDFTEADSLPFAVIDGFSHKSMGITTPTPVVMTENPSTYTIEIKEVLENVVQLDEKYIPESIARVENLVTKKYVDNIADAKADKMTVEEAVTLLSEVGIADLVIDENGDILVNENGDYVVL